MNLTPAEFDRMRSVDVRTVDRGTLVDIKDVHINKTLPHFKKLISYITQVGNPYCYKYGDMIIKEGFSNSGKTMTDCVKQYIEATV